MPLLTQRNLFSGRKLPALSHHDLRRHHNAGERRNQRPKEAQLIVGEWVANLIKSLSRCTSRLDGVSRLVEPELSCDL